mmetsp:Transcript_30368/g.58376  ORF Transcript_30368/g.58376 Transcript_30368/m.58376 type:complete len:297 (-) Transcript_30368:1660-2550(-)
MSSVAPLLDLMSPPAPLQVPQPGQARTIQSLYTAPPYAVADVESGVAVAGAQASPLPRPQPLHIPLQPQQPGTKRFDHLQHTPRTLLQPLHLPGLHPQVCIQPLHAEGISQGLMALLAVRDMIPQQAKTWRSLLEPHRLHQGPAGHSASTGCACSDSLCWGAFRMGTLGTCDHTGPREPFPEEGQRTPRASAADVLPPPPAETCEQQPSLRHWTKGEGLREAEGAGRHQPSPTPPYLRYSLMPAYQHRRAGVDDAGVAAWWDPARSPSERAETCRWIGQHSRMSGTRDQRACLAFQ